MTATIEDILARNFSIIDDLVIEERKSRVSMTENRISVNVLAMDELLNDNTTMMEATVSHKLLGRISKPTDNLLRRNLEIMQASRNGRKNATMDPYLIRNIAMIQYLQLLDQPTNSPEKSKLEKQIRRSLELTSSFLTEESTKRKQTPEASHVTYDPPNYSIDSQVLMDMNLLRETTITLHNHSSTTYLLFKLKTRTMHWKFLSITPNRGLLRPGASVDIKISIIDDYLPQGTHILLLQTCAIHVNSSCLTNSSHLTALLWKYSATLRIHSSRIQCQVAQATFAYVLPLFEWCPQTSITLSNSNAQLTLINSSTQHPLAFRIQTKCQVRYIIRQAHGLIQPQTTTTVSIQLTEEGKKQLQVYKMGGFVLNDAVRVEATHVIQKRMSTVPSTIWCEVPKAAKRSIVLSCSFHAADYEDDRNLPSRETLTGRSR